MDEFKDNEFAYVKLDGNIAVIGNGAGLTLTGMDLIEYYGAKPATFLDVGGGASEESITHAIELVLKNPNVQVIFLNVLGGITRADDVANAVVNIAKEYGNKVPIVTRLTGTNEKEGQQILRDNGISFETSMEKAAKKAVSLLNS
jgi:succinyl-CoA synthetase beta subunit